jgi:hypothetical protein
MNLPGPIYEYEDVGKGKLAEYALGRDTRLVVRYMGHVTTYSLLNIQSGAFVALSAAATERLRETLESLREPSPTPPR